MAPTVTRHARHFNVKILNTERASEDLKPWLNGLAHLNQNLRMDLQKGGCTDLEVRRSQAQCNWLMRFYGDSCIELRWLAKQRNLRWLATSGESIWLK